MSLAAAAARLGERGWARLAPDAGSRAWAKAAAAAAAADILGGSGADRCGGTWDVGLDALPNHPDGTVDGVPLGQEAARLRDGVALHRAQVSVCRPGYPRPEPGESAARTRYRRLRDGAHVDGLLPIDGDPSRRAAMERHLWILGLPLTESPPDAAPFVVWEGSQAILGEALRDALAGHPPDRWAEIDVGPAYRAARARAFETCRRVEVSGRPGEAWLVHRFALHGVAPWRASPDAAPRATAYFRPEAADAAGWLSAP
ncbi:MAG: hypothetical protein AAGI51_16415 [Pseudomonadota bacterium]